MDLIASSVANEFLDLAKKEKSDLTNLKLIKLSYIAQGFSLALIDEPLFLEKIEAWKHGPVVPSIYHEFKHFGKDKITEKAKSIDIDPDSDFFELTTPLLKNKKYKRIVSLTWNLYKDFDAKQLVNFTHAKGTPWYLTYEPNKNKIIKIDLIKRYYAKLIKYLESL